jgi:hypothetical protein
MMKMAALKSPLGTNREKLFRDARGHIYKGVPFKSARRGFAFDADREDDMTSTAYESSDEDPLSRLRVFLDNAGFAQAPEVQELLDALERDRGAADDDDDDDDKLQKMLEAIPGLSAADAGRIAGIVKTAGDKKARDEKLASGTRFTKFTPYTSRDETPKNGITGPRRPAPAMDAASVASIDRIAPGFSAITVETFGQGRRR